MILLIVPFCIGANVDIIIDSLLSIVTTDVTAVLILLAVRIIVEHPLVIHLRYLILSNLLKNKLMLPLLTYYF